MIASRADSKVRASGWRRAEGQERSFAGWGCATPEELARAAAERGFCVVALTDVETLSAQVRFQEACQAHGIRAVCGVELWQEREPSRSSERWVLLARDQAGYENLCRIVSARGSGQATPDALSLIALHHAGLFVLTDHAHALKRALSCDLRREQLMALVVRPTRAPTAQAELLELAAQHGLKAVADGDVVLLGPEDRPLYYLLRAMSLAETVGAVHRREAEDVPRSLTMFTSELFADVPDSVQEAERVLAACSFDILGFSRSLPAFSGTPAEQAQTLEQRCRARLGGRGGAYEERLASELRAISALELQGYFLLIEQLLRELSARGIAHTGRGSAVGCLALHLLGVSPIDPVKHGLLFERFAHLGQAELPDVDIDVASDRRDEALELIRERFGASHVAMVATQVTLKRRAAYRHGLRALGMSAADVRSFLAHMPDDALDLPAPVQRLPPRFRARAHWLEKLIGRFHHRSVHPGGVVISGVPLLTRTPLERAAKGMLVTQLDMHAVDRLGLIKLDVLGNRCLSELATVRALTGHSQEVRGESDAHTLGTLRRARTLGCFQVETPAVRSLLAKIPVHDLEDLCAVLSLVRPGAAAAQAKASFVRRVWGEEAVSFPHPALAPILRATHGLFLYEEDLTRALALLLNVSLAEADAERAALLRGEARTLAWRERFLAFGMSEWQAARLVDEIARLAAYTFSKAHALAYARLAYLSAHDKTHAPSAFAAAVLDHHGGTYPLRALAAELVRTGVRLLSPSVQESLPASHLQEGVRVGLRHVKHLRTHTLERLLVERARRPFGDLDDFRARVSTNALELAALVRAGACDGLAPLSAERYPYAHEAVLEAARHGLPSRSPPIHVPMPDSPEAARRLGLYQKLVRIRNELSVLEMHLSAHPMEVLRPEAARLGALSTAELGQHVGERVLFAGVLSALRRLWDARGELMLFATLEDEHGLVEAVLFSAELARLGDPLRHPGPYCLTATVCEEHGVVNLLVHDVQPFSARDRPFGTRSRVHVAN